MSKMTLISMVPPPEVTKYKFFDQVPSKGKPARSLLRKGFAQNKHLVIGIALYQEFIHSLNLVALALLTTIRSSQAGCTLTISLPLK